MLRVRANWNSIDTYFKTLYKAVSQIFVHFGAVGMFQMSWPQKQVSSCQQVKLTKLQPWQKRESSKMPSYRIRVIHCQTKDVKKFNLAWHRWQFEQARPSAHFPYLQQLNHRHFDVWCQKKHHNITLTSISKQQYSFYLRSHPECFAKSYCQPMPWSSADFSWAFEALFLSTGGSTGAKLAWGEGMVRTKGTRMRTRHSPRWSWWWAPGRQEEAQY